MILIRFHTSRITDAVTSRHDFSFLNGVLKAEGFYSQQNGLRQEAQQGQSRGGVPGKQVHGSKAQEASREMSFLTC